ncbi:gap junction alpha-5 protein isoform X2 [Monodon monoceros]|uniref:gap junction alpha-5 protein isoform X2 n=1 Tax=Monodon monoceros TaxID=40151 RepID=UPI0010F46F17|nr:gap junction alpha-5 protein isoform X2 [Monodon monoceros]
MGDWSFLGEFLEEAHKHSTVIVYLGHAVHTVRMQEKRKLREGARAKEVRGAASYEYPVAEKTELSCWEEANGKIPLRGSLLNTYVCSILIRTTVEVAFIVGQYLLYGIFLDTLHVCRRSPCPHPVNCYVSRPTEKNVFIVFMLAVAGLSLFLSLAELYHLGWKKIKQRFVKSQQGMDECQLPGPSARIVKSCTPPPDFSQCLENGPGGKFFNPFSNKMASQQNTDNLATEQVRGQEQIPGEGFIHIRYAQKPELPNEGSPGHRLPHGYQGDKRRLSKASSKARSDDLSV